METAQVNRIMVEITRLSGAAKEVYELLSAQQNVLKMRGIELDPQMMSQLQLAQEDIANLQKRLVDQGPELAQLRALVRTMSAINSTLDLNQILNDVMDTFVELTEAERGLIVLLDPETHEIQIQTIRGMDENAVNESTFVVSRTVVADVAQGGKTVITTNALEDDRYSAEESIIGYAPRSIICVPLKVKDTVIGVAYSDHRLRAELFGDQERKFLEAFGNQAAIAIENARLYDDVQQRLDQILEIRNFLDNIFASIVSGIITLNTRGYVMSTNRAAEDILGVHDGSSLGHHYSEVIPGLYEGFEGILDGVM
jgi:GAF domain-containing protein